ncbi:phosphatase PAP2 family protein [Parabacteroides sp. PF5-6]|uniref:phosphatase PAP2 family protein n=1 Tax=Parabacteroides sp. PF5-6 TaxID=1742403 RepID=UPI00240544CC|nr:phosphatase PAP2 family protein [Parabacteroides sp. PF5-6]MDF9829580.1 undecaprenyl-diphosphatase [Parabacteroides sp. PF5-6]
MLEKILDYERELFFMLNGSDSVFLDHFMWLFSGKIVWLPLALFILIVLTYKVNWRESLLVLLAIVLVVTLCDQFASHLFKPLFMRFRPTHHPAFMDEVQTVFGYRGGKYGFISSHAANAFGFAMFMTLLFRYKPLFTSTVFLWAIVTAYTRIYLGVHFISDIVPGILVGLVFGYLVYLLYAWVRPKIVGWGGRDVPPISVVYPIRRQRLIVIAILITVILIMLLNAQLVSMLR